MIKIKNRYFQKLYSGVLLSIICSASVADPYTLPPSSFGVIPPPNATAPPPVFCFKVTGGDVLAGGGARLQFEVLNWTGQAATNLRVSMVAGLQITPTIQVPSTDVPGGVVAGSTGGLFDVNSPTSSNGWQGIDGGTVLSTNSVLFFGSQRNTYNTSILFSPGSGSQTNSIQGIDLDPNNDLDFVDAPAIPTPIDSGLNTLDGFILDFPDFNIFERIVLQWDLLDDNLNNVDPDILGGKNPFSFGLFQIDRASNGSIRVNTFVSIGNDLDSLFSNTSLPLDEALTEQNAITLPSTSLAAVPIPSGLWLFATGLMGIWGFVGKRRRQL